MRRYKAVVIDGRRLREQGLAVLIALTLTVVGIAGVRISGRKTDDIGRNILNESIPALGGSAERGGEAVGASDVLERVVSFFLTFNPKELRTILISEIPLLKVVGQGGLSLMAYGGVVEVYNPENADRGEGAAEPKVPGNSESYPIKAIDSSQGKAIGVGKSKILIRNETAYSINIDEMLKMPLRFNVKGEGPKILILHTHATESYSPEGTNTYQSDKSDRSMENDKNMIKVGETMKQIFEEKGIETLHDTTLHDHPNFNGSYANSLKTAEDYKSKYPSIKLILDIHRDAFIYEDGQKAKFVTEINGEKVAQLMMVVGSDAGGLEHPNWRENMKLALKLQDCISGKYPYLMRGVNLRKERFNGHTSLGSLIIEVGASGNTMSEAVRGASLVAAEIADFLKSLG